MRACRKAGVVVRIALLPLVAPSCQKKYFIDINQYIANIPSENSGKSSDFLFAGSAPCSATIIEGCWLSAIAGDSVT
jgi:hypothetical protein